MVFTETDPFGDNIELTDERWQHITRRHPELAGHLDDLQATIREPNVIYRDRTDPRKHYYYRLVGHRYLMAIVLKTAAPFIATAHFMRELSRGGDLVWLKR